MSRLRQQTGRLFYFGGQVDRYRVIKLDAGTPEGVRRFMGDRVDARLLSEGRRSVVVTITRTGKFYDPRYGDFEITKDMLLSMVRNFDANTYGQQIVFDLSHKPQEGGAGFLRKLFLEDNGNKLRGEVELTDYGYEAVKRKGFIYVSAEYAENYVDNEKRQPHGPTLLGAAFTPRPVIKHLDPIELAEGAPDGVPVYVSDKIKRLLSEEITMFKDLLDKLKVKLAGFKLSEPVIKQLCEAFEQVAKPLGEQALQLSLMEQFAATGEELAKQLAAAQPGATIQLSMSGNGLTEDQVRKLLAEAADAQAKAAKKLADDKAANVKIFADEINGAESLKALSDEQKKKLLAAGDLITADMSAEQVRKLAEHQIALGNEMAVSAKLTAVGYQGAPAGTVRHLSIDESNSVKQLQESIVKELRGTAHFSLGKIRLSDKVHPFVEKVLSAFDHMNAERLHREAKMLSGGTTGMGDTSLPASFQRTVIREALSDLRVLELIQALTDPSATVTTGIPYETRDTSAVLNDGIVYEAQGIHRASVSQAMDYAYILPMKLAFLISNEVIHFSRASQINWDAYARNVESNARVMRELVVRRICNELQRAADAYLPGTITNENLDSQLTGSANTIKTAQFPIVRPFQQRDLQGNAVGSPENPITVRLNGVAISEYDGSGTQSAGTYYRVTNYNLGYVQFVNQAGTPVTPSATGNADDISYKYATNVVKFDTDVPSGSTLETHLNGLLRKVGAQKAMMNADRYIAPDFLLMSPILNDTISNAEQFVSSLKRDGSNTNGQGDLESIKGIPAFGTNAPAIDLGDERIIMGQRGTLTYTVAKPFVTGEPFEAVNSAGKPTGQKQAYGEEYSAIKVPTPIRNRLTSVLAYSATGR